MTKHEGLPVAGYRTQSDANVAIVNQNKELEERVLRQIDRISGRSRTGTLDSQQFDQRWVSIAKTQIEQGFMALNRAIFQPGRVTLPEDAPQAGSSEAA